MQRILSLAAVAALAMTGPSYAVGDLARVSIVDRDSGAPALGRIDRLERSRGNVAVSAEGVHE